MGQSCSSSVHRASTWECRPHRELSLAAPLEQSNEKCAKFVLITYLSQYIQNAVISTADRCKKEDMVCVLFSRQVSEIGACFALTAYLYRAGRVSSGDWHGGLLGRTVLVERNIEKCSHMCDFKLRSVDTKRN